MTLRSERTSVLVLIQGDAKAVEHAIDEARAYKGVDVAPVEDGGRCRKALEVVVAALDDAIKANTNGSSGWTQENYDAWDHAREVGEEVLRGD